MYFIISIGNKNKIVKSSVIEENYIGDDYCFSEKKSEIL